MINYINEFPLTLQFCIRGVYYPLVYDTNFLMYYWLLFTNILFKIFISVLASEVDL